MIYFVQHNFSFEMKIILRGICLAARGLWRCVWVCVCNNSPTPKRGHMHDKIPSNCEHTANQGRPLMTQIAYKLKTLDFCGSVPGWIVGNTLRDSKNKSFLL